MNLIDKRLSCGMGHEVIEEEKSYCQIDGIWKKEHCF